MRQFLRYRDNRGRSRRGRRIFRRVRKSPRLGYVIPNGITIVATCSGMMGLLFALQEQWGLAVFSIILASVFDVLDGRMARVFGSSSHFGAELDSLSDVISFGVCPSMVLYLWGMSDAGAWGMMSVLLFTVCCLLRLARFNVSSDKNVDDPDKMSLVWCHYFQGVPSTMAGCVVLAPIVFDMAWSGLLRFYMGDGLSYGLVIWSSILALCMISSLPIFSLKSVRVSRSLALYAIAAGVPLIIASIASRPWLLILTLQILALLTVPISVLSFLRFRRAVMKMEAEKDIEKSVIDSVEVGDMDGEANRPLQFSRKRQ